jgi:hypothetical protein
MKNVLLVIGALIVVILLAFALMHGSTPEKKLPPPPAATPEAKAIVLPKVITLYQKGEGESDLAACVARELARDKGSLASFRLINIMDEPQMVDFYGVNNTPAVIFISSAGKIFRKFEGYVDKTRILAVLSSMDKD